VPGQTLHLAAGQWRYHRPDDPAELRIRVDRVRADISRWYGGAAVWVEAYLLDAHGFPARQRQLLVDCDAIPDQNQQPASAEQLRR
jgi:hypothetical protein